LGIPKDQNVKWVEKTKKEINEENQSPGRATQGDSSNKLSKVGLTENVFTKH